MCVPSRATTVSEKKGLNAGFCMTEGPGAVEVGCFIHLFWNGTNVKAFRA